LSNTFSIPEIKLSRSHIRIGNYFCRIDIPSIIFGNMLTVAEEFFFSISSILTSLLTVTQWQTAQMRIEGWAGDLYH
jgi:hypothetical protein